MTNLKKVAVMSCQTGTVTKLLSKQGNMLFLEVLHCEILRYMPYEKNYLVNIKTPVEFQNPFNNC